MEAVDVDFLKLRSGKEHLKDVKKRPVLHPDCMCLANHMITQISTIKDVLGP